MCSSCKVCERVVRARETRIFREIHETREREREKERKKERKSWCMCVRAVTEQCLVSRKLVLDDNGNLSIEAMIIQLTTGFSGVSNTSIPMQVWSTSGKHDGNEPFLTFLDNLSANSTGDCMIWFLSS